MMTPVEELSLTEPTAASAAASATVASSAAPTGVVTGSNGRSAGDGDAAAKPAASPMHSRKRVTFPVKKPRTRLGARLCSVTLVSVQRDTWPSLVVSVRPTGN